MNEGNYSVFIVCDFKSFFIFFLFFNFHCVIVIMDASLVVLRFPHRVFVGHDCVFGEVPAKFTCIRRFVLFSPGLIKDFLLGLGECVLLLGVLQRGILFLRVYVRLDVHVLHPVFNCVHHFDALLFCKLLNANLTLHNSFYLLSFVFILYLFLLQRCLLLFFSVCVGTHLL